MYICKYVCKYLDLIWCIDCAFVTRKKTYFSKILSLIFALSWPGDTGCCGNGEARDREGSDGCFLCFFFSFFFFRQGHFPTQVFTCQEETQTSYGHRCGHIWSQYGVLRFMGIELRMWYYDTLDCTNIYIYMLSNRRSWPGEI